jgi:hypothetical protein
MSAPPKPRRGPQQAASKVSKFHAEYRVLDIVQAPFGFVFWLIEQRKARLQDRIANTRSDQ